MKRLSEVSWKNVAVWGFIVLTLYTWLDWSGPNNGFLNEAKAEVENSYHNIGRYQVEKISEDKFVILNTITAEAKVYSFKERRGRVEKNGIRLEATFNINSDLPDYTDYTSDLYGQTR